MGLPQPHEFIKSREFSPTSGRRGNQRDSKYEKDLMQEKDSVAGLEVGWRQGEGTWGQPSAADSKSPDDNHQENVGPTDARNWILE